MNLFIKGYDDKSAIISGNFLTTAGLGACVQNCTADANKPQVGSQKAREASFILWLLPDNGLSTSMFILCSVLLFSLFTLWCLKKNQPKPKTLTDNFCYGRMFLINVVVQGMWRLAWLWPQGGRTGVWTCASTRVHFRTIISVFQTEGKAVTSQLSKYLFGPFLTFIITAFAAWP